MSAVHGASVVGAAGRMGEYVRAALGETEALAFRGALEAAGHQSIGTQLEGGVTVHSDPKLAFEGCAVAIDFTVPQATLANLAVAADLGTAYVTGTTGLTPDQHAEIERFASRIPILHAPNFSIAVNVLAWLTREAAQRLTDYDAEIVELHHKQKRDAPSGTALRLAEAIAEGRGQSVTEHLVLERAGEIGARPDDAIGVQTLRGGDNTGEHVVHFIGTGERIELAHRSHTRAHFAQGAVRAAAWLAGRPAGLYRIEQALGLE